MREAYLMALDTSDSGGDQVLHDRSAGARDAGSESDDAWVQRLRQALDSEGFHLVYQPIAALDGTSPSTYEVRLRLAGGSGEEIPPRVSLPPAERTGLMPQIDRWVADRTLRMVQDQEEIRPGTEFLVKLSGASLREEGLNGWVREVCERARALHVQVLFEVSQAVAENHINVVSKLAPVLSELGSGLVIDHFGAGETALDGTTVHLFWADTEFDVWHTSRSHGGSWSASTEWLDAVTAHWIRAEKVDGLCAGELNVGAGGVEMRIVGDNIALLAGDAEENPLGGAALVGRDHVFVTENVLNRVAEVIEAAAARIALVAEGFKEQLNRKRGLETEFVAILVLREE